MMNRIRMALAVAAIGTVMLIIPFMPEASKLRKDAPIINGERYIVVIIPSYKNSQWVDKNLGTILSQNYDNYHVVYIDDQSPDDTFERAQNLVKTMGQSDRVTLICNKERQGALANLYHAIHACPDGAIVATYDGDDWIPDGCTNAFQILNEAYSDPNVWMTYGQFETFPGKHLGICHPMPERIVQEKSYRKEQWFTSHLRTFYAGFFKKIKKEDLMIDGEFYSVAWDQAFMLPMLEMANGRIKFIEDILYVYNQANPLNDFKQHLRKQLHYERLIRRKQPYNALDPKEAQDSFVVV